MENLELKNKLIQAMESVLKEYKEEQKKALRVVPAKPLTKFPEGQVCWMVTSYSKEVHEVKIDGRIANHLLSFEAGRLFPYTPEGKAGAELRKQIGLVPVVSPDWEEDLRKLYDEYEGRKAIWRHPFPDMLEAFFDKYLLSV